MSVSKESIRWLFVAGATALHAYALYKTRSISAEEKDDNEKDVLARPLSGGLQSLSSVARMSFKLQYCPSPMDAERLGFGTDRLQRITAWMHLQVDSGKIPCAQALVSRRGEIAYFNGVGNAHVGGMDPFRPDAVPVSHNSLFRVYSMTKAVTSVCVMMLVEEGKLGLNDPLHKWYPRFKDMQVLVMDKKNPERNRLEPARQPITIKHLMTHTSGFTYGFMKATPVDEQYRNTRVDWFAKGLQHSELMDRLAECPLMSHPGEQWNYSVSTDVLGCLIEKISGQGLHEFMKERVFDPLGMTDTSFYCPPEKVSRLASLYVPWPASAEEKAAGKMYAIQQFDPPAPCAKFIPCWHGAQCDDPECLCQHPAERQIPQREFSELKSAPPSMFCAPVPTQAGAAVSGGGGLLSTALDYHRFVRMITNKGLYTDRHGTCRQMLSRTTLSFMLQNHLPGGKDLAEFATPLFSEVKYDGVGFGLGFAILDSPTRGGVLSSKGQASWGGLASTFFWVDPLEDISVVFMTQLMPSSTYTKLREELRVLVSAALI